MRDKNWINTDYCRDDYGFITEINLGKSQGGLEWDKYKNLK